MTNLHPQKRALKVLNYIHAGTVGLSSHELTRLKKRTFLSKYMVKHVGWHQRQSDESGAYQLQTVAPEPNLTVIQTHIAAAVGVPMQTCFSGCF